MRLISDSIKVELHKEKLDVALIARVNESLGYSNHSLMETVINFKAWTIREIITHLMSQPKSWN